ncbi:HK97-gp10 family putative phage morphogenesis protein [Litorivivens sp.]|uniref:HK97-gp10 family putative phage morphogenesis protein n=1 Tax=Litorivivens sp. TaxID=2020868 RepID=UPI0035663EBB
MASNAVIGVDALKKKISVIAEEVDPKITAQALRAAMKPMLNAARANAPTGKDAHRTKEGRLLAPGFLKRNIKLKKLKSRDKFRIGYGLWAQGDAWYGQALERGRKAGRKGKYAWGAIRPNPWLGKAFNDHKDGVASSFKEEMSKRIMRRVKQIKSRQK